MFFPDNVISDRQNSLEQESVLLQSISDVWMMGGLLPNSQYYKARFPQFDEASDAYAERTDLLNFIWKNESSMLAVNKNITTNYPRKIIYSTFISTVFSLSSFFLFLLNTYNKNYVGKTLSLFLLVCSSYVFIFTIDKARSFKEKNPV
ncbi:hypothetical protein [Acetobacter cerevisiae]|uniref:hypothetical protein n=1 Tax=Acetobacter cerevisiae TaxID=178900 RepID=UPI0020A21F76|nr:hypothetical protein [Acetobacter cerevisiae]MCP1271245.1 hypothetical protein [Acetobacter cerevisiae]MCP1279199.1 hypothetical protein [Acetobacter cerevisiae]